MEFDVLFHGTSGDNVLAIIQSKSMHPGPDRKIFFSRYKWADCLMHGADRKRRANFVMKVKVHIPSTARREYGATQGVDATLTVHTAIPIRAEVIDLHIRRPDGAGGFTFDHVVGERQIEAYLNRK